MQLTQKEFAVLLLLAENEGRILSNPLIYETVWKQSVTAETNGAVKTVMSRLRRKLGEEFIIENDRETDGYSLTWMPG
jgi:DNA-binding response OmpR family regulator